MEEVNNLITFEHWVGTARFPDIYLTIFCTDKDCNSLAEELESQLSCRVDGTVKYVDAQVINPISNNG